MREDGITLIDNTAVRPRFGGNRLTINQNDAAARLLLTQQHPQKGAFPAARRPDYSTEFPGIYRDIDIAQHRHIVIQLRDVANGHRAHILPPPMTAQGKNTRFARRRRKSIAKASNVIQTT